MDDVLFHIPTTNVGDLAETGLPRLGAAAGRRPRGHSRSARLSSGCSVPAASEVRSLVRDLLDRLDTSGRFALLKLATGGLRIGVSARLAKQALAEMGGKEVSEIETLWHGLEPPYLPLFLWLTGEAEMPVLKTPAVFHSVMLATAVGEGDLEGLDPADFAAEWKWDGIRVQLQCRRDSTPLFTQRRRDILRLSRDHRGCRYHRRHRWRASGRRNDAQQPRHRDIRRPAAKAEPQDRQSQADGRVSGLHPCLRHSLFRRARYQARALSPPPRGAVALIEAALAAFRSLALVGLFKLGRSLTSCAPTRPIPVIEGVMLKRLDSPYMAGRAKGPGSSGSGRPSISTPC